MPNSADFVAHVLELMRPTAPATANPIAKTKRTVKASPTAQRKRTEKAKSGTPARRR